MNDDRDSVERLAADIAAGRADSRVHGAVAGGLCSGAHEDLQWQRVIGAAVGALPMGPGLRRVLELTSTALADPDCGFEPLLPGMDEPLPERVAALAEWCDAFVQAFAAGRDPARAMNEEDSELLADLGVIAGALDPEAIDSDDEEDEGDFMQLVEYVRIAALGLFASCEREARPVVHH